jgi:hypothetical protein
MSMTASTPVSAENRLVKIIGAIIGLFDRISYWLIAHIEGMSLCRRSRGGGYLARLR